VDGRRKPLEVQLGRVGFANRVEQFRKLYPSLLGTLKKPQMVDLRHPDRVSLLQ
jgi:cell division septal protein FtsQ